MGVDIGICKYIPEREEKIIRLELLSKLPKEEGKKYKEELYDLYYNEIHKEYYELEKQKIPELDGLIGYRMFNLWYEIDTLTVKIEFSFYNKYCDKRVYPEEIQKIVEDMQRLISVADDDIQGAMEYHIKFYQYLLSHNLMIYPA